MLAGNNDVMMRLSPPTITPSQSHNPHVSFYKPCVQHRDGIWKHVLTPSRPTAPAAPIHRRQGHQARADHRRQAPEEEDEEEKARYASVESAIAFLREHGVDAKDFASK